MRLCHIKTAKECKHRMIGNVFIDSSYVWKNQRIKKIFSGMKSRCYNPNDKNYRWYGAKGIGIYRGWLNNPLSFEEWAINNGYQPSLTINRINEDKDYDPDNCEWITLESNARYKSTTRLITVNGITKTGRQWSDYLHIGTNRVNTYIREKGLNYTIDFIKDQLFNIKTIGDDHYE